MHSATYSCIPPRFPPRFADARHQFVSEHPTWPSVAVICSNPTRFIHPVGGGKKGRGEKKAEHMLLEGVKNVGGRGLCACINKHEQGAARGSRQTAADVPLQNRLNLFSGVVFPTWRRRSFHVPPMRSIWRYSDEDGWPDEREERCERAGSTVGSTSLSGTASTSWDASIVLRKCAC